MTYVSTSFDKAPRYPILQFFHEIHQLYGKHFWLFLKIAAAPALFSTLLWRGANDVIQQLAPGAKSILPRSTDWRIAVAAFAVMRWASFLLPWLVNVFLFAAIAVAVNSVSHEERPSAEDCLNVARDKIGSVIIIALRLAGWLVLALLAAGAAAALGIFLMHLPFAATTAFEWVMGLLGATYAATYSLAVPAVVVEGLGVRAAWKRSDYLTAKSFGLIFILLSESVLGGWIAARLPFYVAKFIYARSGWWKSWADWIVLACSAYGAAMADLVLLIGLSLLYRRLTDADAAQVKLGHTEPPSALP